MKGLNIELKLRELEAIRFEVKGLETGTVDNELEFKESEEVEIEVLEVEGLSIEALELRELETSGLEVTGLVTESEEGWSIEELECRELGTRPEAGSIAEGLASAGRLVERLFVNDQTFLDCHNSRH